MDLKRVEQVLSESEEKLCFICNKTPAKYHIKGMPNDCYCKECANDYFGSVEYLEPNK